MRTVREMGMVARSIFRSATLLSTAHNPFTANSLGTGTGGNITLNSTYAGQTSPLTLGANTTLRATSADGNGGTINITAASQPIDITGADITVTAGGDGNGGTIKATATLGALTLTGNLTAIGVGTGTGGFINLFGSTVSHTLGAGTVDASAGNAGTFTNTTNNITIASLGTLTVPTGSIIRAIAGASAAAGSASGNISISAGTNIVVAGVVSASNSASSGKGGNITLTAGSGSANGMITVNNQVTASALVSGGSGGTVNLFYTDSTGTNPVQIASGALVQADRPSTGGAAGNIVIENDYTENVDVAVVGLLSANNGLVSIAPLGTFEENVQIKGAGQVTGAINIQNALNVTINTATGSVTIDQIKATGAVSISTENSNILSDGNQPITGDTLTLVSGGNIGNLGTQNLLTAVDTMTVTANSSTSVAQNVAVSNTDTPGDNLTLNNSAASGSFELTTNNSLTVGSVTAGISSGGTVYSGNLSLETTEGDAITITSTIDAPANVSSQGGSVSVTSVLDSTVLNVQPGAEIVALGIKDVSAGIVTITMGTPTGLVAFVGLPYFELTTGSLNPQVGPSTPPFTADSRISYGTVLNSMITIYGNSSSSITFEGGNKVSAITPQ
jgi:hypothetical protein